MFEQLQGSRPGSRESIELPLDPATFRLGEAENTPLANASPASPAVGTIQQIAEQLVSGFWGGDSHHWAVTQGGTLTVDITTLNPSEQMLAREALATWTHVTGIFFQEVTSGAQIVFDDSDGLNGPVAETSGTWSNGIISSEHIHISSDWVGEYGTGLNTYSFQTYIHEIGHALGLGHPGSYNETATYATDAIFANDAWSTSVMSYFSQTDNSYFAAQGFTEAFDNTPMMADIVAVQQLYGLSTVSASGDTTYTFSAGSGAVCIYDAGGTDWFYATGYFGSQFVNLSPGTFSNINGSVGNVSIAPGTIIENALGGPGADTILGNDADNYLIGGEGRDTLVGGAGNDTLVGDGPNAANGSADTMTGGLGSDTFQDSRANFNGDTITDFSRDDKIVFTDASTDTFTFSFSGNLLTYPGGSLTLSGVTNGLVAHAAPGGGVQVTFAGPPIINSPFVIAPLESTSHVATASEAQVLVPPATATEQQQHTDVPTLAVWHSMLAAEHTSAVFDYHDQIFLI